MFLQIFFHRFADFVLFSHRNTLKLWMLREFFRVEEKLLQSRVVSESIIVVSLTPGAWVPRYARAEVWAHCGRSEMVS
jgi:hypothetical protein